MAKPPTPQGISALLRKGGFERSVTQKSMIRGGREWTAGFTATKHHRGGVVVTWQPQSFQARSDRSEQRQAMLDRYRTVLAQAGWAVTDHTAGSRTALLVSANEEA